MIIADALVDFACSRYFSLLIKVISPKDAFSIEDTPVIFNFLSPIISPLNTSARFLILKSILFIII